MFTKYDLNRIVVLLMAVFALSACAPRVEVTSAPTPLPVATETPAPHFEGLSSGLDNTKQARIRTVSMIMGAPNSDVYVNGMLASSGGIAQQNIGPGQFSGWLYVTPGTYTVALIPHGGTVDQALFPPSDVNVEAGHRYTVAAMGQLADKDVHPLVVDETTMEAGLGASSTDNIAIDINNLKGADSITEQAYGKTTAENIKYGEVRAWFAASGTAPLKTLANGKTPGVLYASDGFGIEPGISVFLPYFGPFPAANYDSIGNASQGTSELNVIDFLAGFDGRNVIIEERPITFNTLLAAIEKAGLHDQMANSGPYFLLAPTDAAFAEMPQAERDALLNDPQALMNFFKAIIIDGYYPSGSLSGAKWGAANRNLTNRLGQTVGFFEDDVNGQLAGPNYTVGNGNRVQVIYTMLSVK